MRRTTASAACLMLLVGLVGSCSNAEVGASELGEWMSAQETPGRGRAGADAQPRQSR